MINLNFCPRTEAEAQASMLLTEVARIGELYYKIFMAQPTFGVASTFDYLLNNMPPMNDCGATEYHVREAKKQFENMDDARKAAEIFVAEMLMQAIDEFNAACDAIKNDPRPRSEILKAEAPKPQKNKPTKAGNNTN